MANYLDVAGSMIQSLYSDQVLEFTHFLFLQIWPAADNAAG